MTRIPLACGALALLVALSGSGVAERAAVGGPRSEVVVELEAPPLAGRSSPADAVAVDREQATFAAALRTAIPGSSIRWRYRIVLNGAAVVVPRAALPTLRRLPGVRRVDESTAYPVARSGTPVSAVARAVWQTGLPNQGAGVKIGFIDDGIDQRHPYFSPVGYAMPPGFPKGQTAYTTAKVIVARAFAPASTTWKYARLPFDPADSEHATHVAGIAAGNANTTAAGGVVVSGVAPRAYIGNYKALTVPTPGVGLDGNAAEIVAAIEAAVKDGMNVINLSIGEPEVEPSRDVVASAIDAAAAAGVVPVVAAGNDYDEFGAGSVASPGSASRAITVAAVSLPSSGRPTLAYFSAAGPTAISLRLKPDVSAPGVGIFSSVPDAGWETMSGTSMATPQIAGVVALLKERHPTWGPAAIKAALMETGSQVLDGSRPASPIRGGGGIAVPAKADVPLVLATPASVGLGLVAPDTTTPFAITLADTGGGAGPWDVAVETISTNVGASLALPATVTVPGPLDASAVVAATAPDGDFAGFIRLTHGTEVRRIPFWLRVAHAALTTEPATPIVKPGIYTGNTRGRPSLVAHYRYPEVPAGGPVTATLAGPEQVFRVTLPKAVANFGVVITKRGTGVTVEPRVVAAADENRLTGYAGLPTNLNPYLRVFGDRVPAAGAVRPLAGSYDVVFDSATAAGAGSYSFRYWVNDTTPPAVVVGPTRTSRGTVLLVRVTDAGAGPDPATLVVSIDGVERAATLRNGVVRIATAGLSRGSHRLRIQVSDYQESRNMENVPPILPNTRSVTKTLVVR